MGKKECNYHFIIVDQNGLNQHNCSVRTSGRRRRVQALLRDVRYGVDAPEPRIIRFLAATEEDTHI